MFASRYLLPIIIACVTVIAYWPGLGGDFVLDDYPNIVLNEAITSAEFTWQSLAAVAGSSQAGPGGRPIAMLSFAFNHMLGGLDPFGYKAVNLAIHLVNAGLIFLLVRRIIAAISLARSADAAPPDSAMWLAGLTTLLWAVHPLNLTAVLYLVQRMTSLSTSFMLISLLAYLHLRQSAASGWLGYGSRVLLLGVSACAAYYTKESALLLPVYALVLEGMLLKFRSASGTRALRAVYLAGALMPLAWLLWHWLQDPAWFANMYQLRPYTVLERLLTESRALWFYLYQILLPTPAALGLHHDDFGISTGLFTPYTTLLSLLAHAAVITSAWFFRQRWPYFAFAAAWFYGGHLLESTIFPLEPVFEHRNYLPMLGPVLLLAVAAWRVADSAGSGPMRRIATLCLLALPFTLVTAVRANQWADPHTLALSEAEHHPDSARANYAAGSLLLNQLFRHPERQQALGRSTLNYLLAAAAKDADALDPFVAAFQMQAAFGTPLPPDFHARFIQRLRNGIPPGNYIEVAFGLKNLLQLPYPHLSHAQMRAIYQAALSNPRLGGKHRGHMLVSYALFLANQAGEYAPAALALDEAMRLLPDRQDLKVIAVNVALQLGQPERAERLIAAAEAADAHGLYRHLIAQARANLHAYRLGSDYTR